MSGSRRYQRDVERHVVAQCTIAPRSKLEATRWAPREVVLPGVGELSDDGLYRAMDFLLECSERVPEAVFFSVANLLNGEFDVIVFRYHQQVLRSRDRRRRRPRRPRHAGPGHAGGRCAA